MNVSHWQFIWRSFLFVNSVFFMSYSTTVLHVEAWLPYLTRMHFYIFSYACNFVILWKQSTHRMGVQNNSIHWANNKVFSMQGSSHITELQKSLKLKKVISYLWIQFERLDKKDANMCANILIFACISIS